MPMTSDVKARRTILPNDTLILEGEDGQECYKYFKNYALCYLPIEVTLHPKLAVAIKIFLIWFVVKKGWQVCYCVICANKVGIWNA